MSNFLLHNKSFRRQKVWRIVWIHVRATCGISWFYIHHSSAN